MIIINMANSEAVTKLGIVVLQAFLQLRGSTFFEIKILRDTETPQNTCTTSNYNVMFKFKRDWAESF